MPAHGNNAKVWDQLLMGRHYSLFALATVGSELILSNLMSTILDDINIVVADDVDVVLTFATIVDYFSGEARAGCSSHSSTYKQTAMTGSNCV